MKNVFIKNLFIGNFDCGETFEICARNVGDEGVQFVFTVFIFIMFAGEPDAESLWHVPDSLGPGGLV